MHKFFPRSLSPNFRRTSRDGIWMCESPGVGPPSLFFLPLFFFLFELSDAHPLLCYTLAPFPCEFRFRGFCVYSSLLWFVQEVSTVLTPAEMGESTKRVLERSRKKRKRNRAEAARGRKREGKSEFVAKSHFSIFIAVGT